MQVFSLVVWLYQVKDPGGLPSDEGMPVKTERNRTWYILQLELAGLADGLHVAIQKRGIEANSQVSGLNTWVNGGTLIELVKTGVQGHLWG